MADLLTSPARRQDSRGFTPSHPSPLRSAVRLASDRTNDGGATARASGDTVSIEGRLNGLKKELKIWERTFQRENGREPIKEDISKIPEIGSRSVIHSFHSSQK